MARTDFSPEFQYNQPWSKMSRIYRTRSAGYSTLIPTVPVFLNTFVALKSRKLNLLRTAGWWLEFIVISNYCEFKSECGRIQPSLLFLPRIAGISLMILKEPLKNEDRFHIHGGNKRRQQFKTSSKSNQGKRANIPQKLQYESFQEKFENLWLTL